MSTVQPFLAGGYRFITHQFQYSGGVAAELGFLGELIAGELRALISIEDAGLAEPGESLAQRLAAEPSQPRLATSVAC